MATHRVIDLANAQVGRGAKPTSDAGEKPSGKDRPATTPSNTGKSQLSQDGRQSQGKSAG